MIVYILRHGQTVWNVTGIIQGRRKNRLSKVGKNQVEKTAQTLKKGDIDIIFSSPVMRTMQTSNIVNQVLQTNIVKDERLSEIDEGVFTGRKEKSLTEYELKAREEDPKSFGVETREEMRIRLKDFLEFLKEKHSSSKVLIVTHAYCAEILEKIITNKEGKNFDNADLRKFII